jgi:serine/threonine protein kinase
VSEQVFTDTTEFHNIDRGDIIQIGDKRYLVTGNERERRFGVTDPKYWVKRCLDLDTNEKKILKLTFFETFFISLAGIKIKRFRDPKKEENILALVKDHPYFMHGTSHQDKKGNSIRVLDIVQGTNFYVYLESLTMEHEIYFHEILPGILENLLQAFKALRFLHLNGFRHGDVRNDHMIIERETKNYVWIDFDYEFEPGENPFSLDIFGLGNILLYACGKGFHDYHMISRDKTFYGDLSDRIEQTDFSILNKWRLFNLHKLYPYIPTVLNDILMHFSADASVYYETVDEIIEDITRCTHLIFNK